MEAVVFVLGTKLSNYRELPLHKIYKHRIEIILFSVFLLQVNIFENWA